MPKQYTETWTIPTSLPDLSAPAKRRRASPTTNPQLAQVLKKYSVLLRRAALNAGRSVKVFCELLDRARVPDRWGMGSWMKAYMKRDANKKYVLRDAIRGIKYRALHPKK